MLLQTVVEPAQTDWTAPTVLTQNMGGSIRFWVYYRKLKNPTRWDSYLIQNMDGCISFPSKATDFSTVNAHNESWQVNIEDEDQNKRLFTSNHGLYRFVRMPFGLKIAPKTFQRTMDFIFASIKWQFTLFYLDDILISSNKSEKGIDHLKQVLKLLQHAEVVLSLKKCFFWRTQWTTLDT